MDLLYEPYLLVLKHCLSFVTPLDTEAMEMDRNHSIFLIKFLILIVVTSTINNGLSVYLIKKKTTPALRILMCHNFNQNHKTQITCSKTAKFITSIHGSHKCLSHAGIKPATRRNHSIHVVRSGASRHLRQLRKLKLRYSD